MLEFYEPGVPGQSAGGDSALPGLVPERDFGTPARVATAQVTLTIDGRSIGVRSPPP